MRAILIPITFLFVGMLGVIVFAIYAYKNNKMAEAYKAEKRNDLRRICYIFKNSRKNLEEELEIFCNKYSYSSYNIVSYISGVDKDTVGHACFKVYFQRNGKNKSCLNLVKKKYTGKNGKKHKL